MAKSAGHKLASAFYSGAAAIEAGIPEDEELQETIILNICAMDFKSLTRASDKLDKFQDDEFTSEVQNTFLHYRRQILTATSGAVKLASRGDPWSIRFSRHEADGI